MRTPYVSLENAPAVTEYFTQKEPLVPLLRLVHFVMGRAIIADTIFEEGAREEIGEDLSLGRQIFLVHNHQNFFDPLVLASILQREEVFHPMRTRTVIPGKSPLFNKWYGWVIRNGGAVPVFRAAEFPGDEEHSESELAEARKRANEPLIAIMQAHFNNSLHGAIYPEGTRGEHLLGPDGKEIERDVTKILPVYKGIGRIVCGLDDPDNVRMVYVGTVYGPDHDDIRHPTSFVSRPSQPAATVEDVTDLAAYRLQKTLDAALDAVPGSRIAA
jgi:1-acyl-sn-glycerol-3-phosphate acyltransferase